MDNHIYRKYNPVTARKQAGVRESFFDSYAQARLAFHRVTVHNLWGVKGIE